MSALTTKRPPTAPRVPGRLARCVRSFRPATAVSALLALLMLAGCQKETGWHETVISGAMPDLALSMTRAEDGKAVTAADYRGKVALLYFGYTFCPDICPTTLANVATILQGLGSEADDVRVLFVTVDPDRDTADVLNQYTDAFAPQVDGMRGTDDQLAALARRYRVAYSVTPSDDPAQYKVTHSPAIYVFDRRGTARLLLSSLGTDKPGASGAVADLKRLVGERETGGFLALLEGLL